LTHNLEHSYGLLKSLGEHFTKSLGGLVVRLYNIYGKEDISDKSHVVPDIINQAKTQNCINLNTNGLEERQFLYVEDCCRGLYVISQNYDELLEQNSIIDLTSFEWISIKEIAQIVSEICNSKINYSKIEADYNSKCDPNRVILNYWKPSTQLKDGIYKVIVE
jgi:nucleoside-diphosphate-sugar epimerase